MRIRFCMSIAAMLAAIGAPTATFADEDVTLVVNPRTGAAEIRNDTDSAIELDGYLLRASSGLFDPVEWNSFQEQSLPGWVNGPAANNRLADTNLLGSSTLPAGGSLGIGSPYVPFSPASVGLLEPTFDFTYSVPGVGTFSGDVEFESRNTLVLEVDLESGDATLVNQSTFPIDLDGYIVTSAVSVLDPAGWSPLQGSTAGWQAAVGADSRIAEGNLLGSTLLAPNAELPIGLAIDAATLDDETDLSLRYNIAGVGQFEGGVLFVDEFIPGPEDGDATGDMVVDVLDLDILGTNFNLTPATAAEGDFNGDNVVDVLDLDILGTNFGAGAPATAFAVAVPEPASIGGVLLAMLAGVGAGRRG